MVLFSLQIFVVLLGFCSLIFLLYCFWLMLKEKWTITNYVAGMISGEIICVVSALIFSTYSVINMNNGIPLETGIVLRILIFSAPPIFTGGLVRSIKVIKRQHAAAQVGLEYIEQIKEDLERLKQTSCPKDK